MSDASLTAVQLRGLAPEPFARWDGVAAGLESAMPADGRRGLQRLVAGLLRFDGTGSDGFGAGDRAAVDLPVLELAEQFVVDVSAVTEEQRSAAMAALGADAFTFVQVLYATDFGTRMSSAWRHLFGADPEVDPAGTAALWPALESFMSAVARLDALDPLTTELVRLRGARAHNCRLCKSIRNVRAANAGADESIYDQIEHYQSSTLSVRHQTALRLVDTMVWEPCAYPEDLVAAVRASFTDAEAMELVFDIARNAANKIAVAFGADEAHVVDGIEFYDIDDRGDLVYGLTPNR